MKDILKFYVTKGENEPPVQPEPLHPFFAESEDAKGEPATPNSPPTPPPPIVPDLYAFGYGDATVEAVIRWYKARKITRSRSVVAQTERNRIWALFIEAYGTLHVDSCGPYMLVDFIGKQKGLKSNWSKRRWALTINVAFNFAAEMQLISSNPFRAAKYLPGGQGRDWTNEEFRTLLRSTDAVFRRFLVFIRFSGMRPGEIRGLEWSDIFYEDSVIVIPGDRTKSGRARKIPINTVMAKLLVWIKKRSFRPFVFVSTGNDKWEMSGVNVRFRRLREKAGLSEEVSLHGGRHTFATRAILAGVDLRTLAELLGHADIKSTERYVHLTNKVGHLQGAMQRAITQPKPAAEGGAS